MTEKGSSSPHHCIFPRHELNIGRGISLHGKRGKGRWSGYSGRVSGSIPSALDTLSESTEPPYWEGAVSNTHFTDEESEGQNGTET